MTKALSIDLRERVVAVIDGGLSLRQAAARFGGSVSSAIPAARVCQPLSLLRL